MKPGIFAEYKSRGIYSTNENYFQIVGPEFYIERIGFCDVQSIPCGPLTNLFDGNVSTGYESKDINTKAIKNISINFKKDAVNIYAYSLYTMCFPHSEISVDGSNNGIDWTEIDHLTTTYSINSENYFTVFCPRCIKYFKNR